MAENKRKHAYYSQQVLGILKQLQEIAKREKLPSIGPIKGKIISNIIERHRSTSILEIGSLHGYSAILMAAILPDDGKLISIEIDENLASIARENIDKAGLSNKIKIICDDAINAIPKLKGHRFDMVFLDATKSDYLRYLKLIEQNDLMEDQAIVVADNVILYENEMSDYLDYVRKSGIYTSHRTKCTLEFNKKVKDALEVSLRLEK